MYHSEHYQDAFVADLIRKRDGTFVEFGALDGILHSNSLYFEEEMGWTGLLIEANPAIFQSLQENRPRCKTVNAAVYDHSGIVEFEKIEGGLFGWSGIKEAMEPEHTSRVNSYISPDARSIIEVPCWPLASILNDAGIKTIDYLSIDVEGAEQKILSVFPFSEYDIDVIGVEDNFGNEQLDALIMGNGFRFLGKVGPDRIYRKS